MELIRPLVEERLAKMEELGDAWNDAPVRQFVSFDILFSHAAGAQNDMLMWLISEAKGVEKSVEGLARRMLLINFASIYTTSLVSGIISESSELLVTVYSNFVWRRHLRKYCTAFLPTRNILNLSAKRSKLR